MDLVDYISFRSQGIMGEVLLLPRTNRIRERAADHQHTICCARNKGDPAAKQSDLIKRFTSTLRQCFMIQCIIWLGEIENSLLVPGRMSAHPGASNFAPPSIICTGHTTTKQSCCCPILFSLLRTYSCCLRQRRS